MIPYRKSEESYMEYSKGDLSAYLSKKGHPGNILDDDFEENERRADAHVKGDHEHLHGHGNNAPHGRIRAKFGKENDNIFGVKSVGDEYSTYRDDEREDGFSKGHAGDDGFNRDRDREDFDSHPITEGRGGDKRGVNRKYSNNFQEDHEEEAHNLKLQHRNLEESNKEDLGFNHQNVGRSQQPRTRFDNPKINTELSGQQGVTNHQKNRSNSIPLDSNNQSHHNDNYNDHHIGNINYEKKNTLKSHNPHDEVPIGGASEGTNKSFPEEDRPIKGTKGQLPSTAFTSKEANSNQYRSKPSPPAQNSSKSNIDHYEDEEVMDVRDVPLNEHEKKQIKNTHKTFEQLLEEQLAAEGLDFDPLPPETNPTQSSKRTFLKKNSRGAVAPKAKPPIKKATGLENKKDKVNKDTHKSSLQDSVDKSDDDNVFEHKEYNAQDYLKSAIDQNKPPTNTREGEKGAAKDKSTDLAASTTQPKTVTYDDQEAWDKPEITTKLNSSNQAPGGDNNTEGQSVKPTSSKLLETYFKSEKDKKDIKNKEEKQAVKEEEEIVKKYVNEKLEELNKEAKRLKDERERVKVKERKLEEDSKKLAKEREEWDSHVTEEKQKISELKEEELRKMKKEKKIAERNQKAVMNMPNRKD